MEWQTVAVFIVSQLITAAGIVSALKTDLSWLKKDVEDHEKRLRVIENGSS